MGGGSASGRGFDGAGTPWQVGATPSYETWSPMHGTDTPGGAFSPDPDTGFRCVPAVQGVGVREAVRMDVLGRRTGVGLLLPDEPPAVSVSSVSPSVRSSTVPGAPPIRCSCAARGGALAG